MTWPMQKEKNAIKVGFTKSQDSCEIATGRKEEEET